MSRMRWTSIALALGVAMGAWGKPPAVIWSEVPLFFEANRGQTDSKARFLARSDGLAAFFTDQGPLIAAEGRIWRMRIPHARWSAPVPGQPLRAEVSSFIGNNPNRWLTHIPAYGQVAYREVLPGVDLVFHGNHRQLEYDLVVSKPEQLARLRVSYEGLDALSLDARGDLHLGAGPQALTQRRPRAYQTLANGGRQAVQAGYAVTGRRQVAFALGAFDESRPVIIDPVLEYSTYFGGSGIDSANGLAIDGSGNVYIAGSTNSPNFPTRGAEQPAYGTNGDAFVAELNPSGGLIYSTFLGGTANENANGLAIGPGGVAVVVGYTASSDFPTTAGALQTTYRTNGDAFITELSPTGMFLSFSTYLGGTNQDAAYAVTVNVLGQVFVTGATNSVDFPTKNPLQGIKGANAFVARLDSVGSSLLFSTFLGGTTSENGAVIALDGNGDLYVAGDTGSSDFPTLNAFQPIFGGGAYDAFLTKYNDAGTAVLYSTFFGGSGDDYGRGLAVNPHDGSVFVAGRTSSLNLTTRFPLQAALDGGNDVFVMQMSADGGNLLFSTYLGGNGDDGMRSLVLDSNGALFVLGQTTSTNFPTRQPLQDSLAGSYDLFLTELTFGAGGAAMPFSTYLGGTGSDNGLGMSVDGAGHVFVGGNTTSLDFPTVDPLQASLDGGQNAFVVVISLDGGSADAGTQDAGSEPGPDAGQRDAGAQDAGAQDAGVGDGGRSDSGTQAADAAIPHADAGSGAYRVGCGCAMTTDAVLAGWLLALVVALSRPARRKRAPRPRLAPEPRCE